MLEFSTRNLTPHQRAAHKIRVVAWPLVMAVWLAGILGLFGGRGPLNVKRENTSKISIEYEQFLRTENISEIKIERIAPIYLARESEAMELWFSADYLKNLEIESITPEPVKTVFAGDRIKFYFAHEGKDTRGDRQVVFYIRPNTSGSLAAKIGTSHGEEEFQIKQWVYP